VRGKGIWMVLIAVSAVFVTLYLYYTLFPGAVASEVWQYFTGKQVQMGREYHRSSQLLYIFGFIVQVAILSWLVFSSRGERVGRWATAVVGGNRIAATLLFFLILWLLLQFFTLPFHIYKGYFLQHQWGFSTQSLAGWWRDYLINNGLELILSAVGVFLLFGMMARWPSYWWVSVGLLMSLWILVQAFLWPVVVAPIANKFQPVTNQMVLQTVERLSRRADLAVDRVLMMDASKRTTKANAYFAGVGSTRRIVLYDNLLQDYSAEEIEAVIAHEMAHWKLGHITRGIIYGMFASFLIWFFVFIMLRFEFKQIAGGAYPAHSWAAILLFFTLLSFVTNPVQNAVSRHMETEADIMAVKLSGNPGGTVSLLKSLATKDLADVDPPRFIEWFSYSHPGIINRIESIERLDNR